MFDLDIEVTDQGGWTVIAVGGEIDVATAPRLRERLHEIVADGRARLVVDLGRVDFIDSTGIGVLIGALKRTRIQGGDLVVVCREPRVLKVFDIIGLTKVFAVHPTVDEAIAAG